MKRLICLLLALLMLSGCGRDISETQSPAETTLAAPTEPSGFYDPDSTVEMFTGGAVRTYPLLIPDAYAISAAGSDLLVFSGRGDTKLTRLTGENLFRIAEIQLDTILYPGDSGLLITEDRVVYYSQRSREFIWLDECFREFNRQKLPEDMTGGPVISGDCLQIYYGAGNAIRVLDVETGRTRLLTETAYPEAWPTGLLMQDTVLQCAVADDTAAVHYLFFDVETGAMLRETENPMTVLSEDDRYYLYAPKDEGQNLIFGRDGEPLQTLNKSQDLLWAAQFLPESHGVVCAAMEENQKWLEYFDLATGKRTAALQIPEPVIPRMYAADGEKGYVYFLGYGEAESHVVYRWDLAATPTGEDTVYTNLWYTPENPDLEGLTHCQARADALGQKYGVDIRIWERALENQPWDYGFTMEYRTDAIGEGLDQLETLLGQFPEDFFTKAMEGMEDGGLHLCLVQSLQGSAETGSLDSAEGIQFWDGNDAYVAIALGEGFEKAFFHEMFHVLETRALSRSIAYYRWDELNPKGFHYDYDYVANQYRDEYEYVDDDTTRCFIDTYSMSFPKEDRARIFEFACTEGNEQYFISHTMQRKLRTLCEGIREAYDLEKSTEVFLWEQYLESPLASK